MQCEFHKFVRARDLLKQEGLALRHLLRLVILAGEFLALTQGPEYHRISDRAAKTCHRVDPKYSDRFLAEATEMRKVAAPGG